jgi:hypothetical protein
MLMIMEVEEVKEAEAATVSGRSTGSVVMLSPTAVPSPLLTAFAADFLKIFAQAEAFHAILQ